MKVPENLILVRGGIAESIKGDILIMDTDGIDTWEPMCRHLDPYDELYELQAMAEADDKDLQKLTSATCMQLPKRKGLSDQYFALLDQVKLAFSLAERLGVEGDPDCVADAVGMMVQGDVLPVLATTYKLLFPCK